MVAGTFPKGSKRVDERFLLVTTRVHRSLPADATAPAQARDALVPLTSRVPPHTAQDLKLVVSELVSNAVKHAGLRERERIELEVSTHGTRTEVLIRYPEHTRFRPTLPPEPAESSRWGLFLVDQISDRWSLVEEKGSLVAWCELGVPRRT